MTSCLPGDDYLYRRRGRLCVYRKGFRDAVYTRCSRAVTPHSTYVCGDSRDLERECPTSSTPATTAVTIIEDDARRWRTIRAPRIARRPRIIAFNATRPGISPDATRAPRLDVDLLEGPGCNETLNASNADVANVSRDGVASVEEAALNVSSTSRTPRNESETTLATSESSFNATFTTSSNGLVDGTERESFACEYVTTRGGDEVEFRYGGLVVRLGGLNATVDRS